MLRPFATLAVLFALMEGAGADSPKAPGLGNPGTLRSLQFETSGGKGPLVLSGRDASEQMLVAGLYSSGQQRDLTRSVKFDVQPQDIVRVEPSGRMVALREGEAKVQVSSGGQQTSLLVQVRDFQQDAPLSFTNDIVPILTRYGCNAGGCHGKSGGQNGFALSLLGFEPATTPISPGNLLSTLMHTLFDVGVLRVTRGAPTNLVRLIEDHRPIAELF